MSTVDRVTSARNRSDRRRAPRSVYPCVGGNPEARRISDPATRPRSSGGSWLHRRVWVYGTMTSPLSFCLAMPGQTCRPSSSYIRFPFSVARTLTCRVRLFCFVLLLIIRFACGLLRKFGLRAWCCKFTSSSLTTHDKFGLLGGVAPRFARGAQVRS